MPRRGERKQGGGQQFFHGLFYIKHQSLEVFAFGMVDVDWVVGGLGQLVQDAHLAACDGGGGKDRRAEQLLRDGLRAGEREEDAAGFDLRNGAGVEPLVALQGVAQHFVVFGEGRRRRGQVQGD